MRALEDRGTPFVARLRRNAVLDRLAERAGDEAVQKTWYDLCGRQATMRGCGGGTMHVLRTLLERATQTGWSLRRLLERVLRVPARFTVSERRVVTIVGRSARH